MTHTASIQWLRLRMMLLVAAFVAWPTAVLAGTEPGTVPTAPGDQFLTLEPGTVQLLIAGLIPFLVGLLTKATWSPKIKGALVLVLNGVGAAVVAATLADGRAAWSETTLRETLLGIAISVATYYQVFKPLNLISGSQPNGTPGRLNNVGVH